MTDAPPYAPTPQQAGYQPQGSPQQGYAQQPPAQQPPAQHPPAPARAPGNLLRRWPVWAQNTALIVGAVAVLVVVFFAGFFTGQANGGPQRGLDMNQDFGPRTFGGGTGADGSGQPGS
jgi:hypothetical protein